MAEDKKSFILYCDLIHVINKLDDGNTGKLFKHILNYVNDFDPEPENIVVDLVFEPIKRQLKRDLEKFNKHKENKSNQGRLGNLKRWNPDLYNKVKSNEIDLDMAENIAISRKASLGDSSPSLNIAQIAVNDNVNDNVTDINNIMSVSVKPKYEFDFDRFLIFFNETLGKKHRIINTETRNKIIARLKEGYTKHDFLQAVLNIKQSKHHIDSNFRHATPYFIARPEKLEMYCGQSEESHLPRDTQPKQLDY